MNPLLPNLPFFDAVTVIGYWSIVVLSVLTSLGCATVAYRYPRRALVYTSAGALGFALLLLNFPSPRPPAELTVVLGLAALALATIGGGPAVQLVLALAGHGSMRTGVFGGIVVAAQGQEGQSGATREVLRGGTTIGFLERFATAGSILAGFPEAIVVLVAIKSVGRYSELDVPEARERFIIGTLVSLIWASACAGILHLATH
jgi:hypothetical protein